MIRVSILLLLLIAACSAPVTRTELDSSLASAGATIGVLPVNVQQKIEARVDDNPIGLAGTAGRLAVFKGEQTRQKRLNEALAAADFDYRDRFRQRLSEALTSNRLNIQDIAFQRTIDNVLGEVAPGRFERRPPKDQPVDFLLDVTVDAVGYIAESINKDYLPTLHVGVRLLDADSLDVVYETRVEYNPLDPEEATVKLAADERYTFKDTRAMAADTALTADGLLAAMDAVLMQISGDLAALAAESGD